VTAADASANSETPILRRLKPGITGWDQIEQDCGRSDDWSYPQKQSLRFYFLILARTIVSAIMRDRRQ
jgi:lipopolysaccharide/colanic/teichoic acid biosynthesis glycosyltransferase